MAKPARARPERTCIGCGVKKAQSALVRVALGPDNRVELDRSRVKPGRGGYLCGPACIEAANKRKGWGRAFRTKVQVESEELKLALGGSVTMPGAALTPSNGKH